MVSPVLLGHALSRLANNLEVSDHGVLNEAVSEKALPREDPSQRPGFLEDPAAQ